MQGQPTTAEHLSAVLRPLVDPQSLVRAINEPLDRSAPIAFAAALELCEGKESHDCRAYHAVWQYLRLLDIWPSMRIDGPLFVAAAERLGADGQLSNVLVSGSADYAMLAHIAHGARRGGVAPSVDVLDRCATSLRMNAWYGAERGVTVGTKQAPVLDFQPTCQYDLITTHTFISMQTFGDRPALFRKWGEWLRPGGRLCFSDRVSTVETPYDPEGRARRLEKMAADTLTRFTERGIALPCPSDEFVALIRQFGMRFYRAQPAMPVETIAAWAEDAGMRMEVAVPVGRALSGGPEQSPLSDAKSGRIRTWFQFQRQ